MSSTAPFPLELLYDPTKGKMESRVVQAGAGAGKTTELITRILSVAIDHRRESKKWPRIVMTTFTLKATAEIIERLHLGVQQLTERHEEFQAKFGFAVPEDLREFSQNPHYLLIGTIHSVLSQFLRQHMNLLGYANNAEILGGLDWARAVDHFWRQFLVIPASGPDERQRQYQVLRRKYSHTQLEQGLLLVFTLKQKGVSTNHYSQEIHKKLQADFLLNLRALHAEVHSGLSLRSGSLTDAAQKVFECLSQPDWLAVVPTVKLLLRPGKVVPKELADNFSELKKRVSLWFEQYSDEVGDLLVQETKEVLSFLSPLADQLQKYCQEQSMITMADLENLALRLSHNNPNLAQQFAKNWDFWMIDEFQDSAPEQVQILAQLRGEKPAFFVGDPQQSIYLFRGADREVFLREKLRLSQQGGESAIQYKLENYRSGATLLESINAFFSRLDGSFAPMIANRTTPSEPVHVVDVGDQDMAEQVAKRVQRLLDGGQVAPGQICILGHRRQALNDVASYLKKLGITCRVVGGKTIFTDLLVLDALAVLQFLVNPSDNKNLVALLRTGFLPITDAELVQFCTQARRSKKSLWDVLRNSGLNTELETQLSKAETAGLTATWISWLEQLGFWERAWRQDPSGQKAQNLWKCILVLHEAMAQPEFTFAEWLEQAWQIEKSEKASDELAEAVLGGESKEVQLMTVFAAKGLQFEHLLYMFPTSLREPVDNRLLRNIEGVLVVDRVENSDEVKVKSPLFSDYQAQQKEAFREELHRLVYVAVTRAKMSCDVFYASPKNSFKELCDIFAAWPHRRDLTDPSEDCAVQQALISPPSPKTPLVDQKKLLELLAEPKIGDSAYLTHGALKAIVQGIEFHKQLEKLRYQEREKQQQFVDQYLQDCPLQVRSALQTVLQGGHAEYGFFLSNQQGRIDLWGFADVDQVWIFDYKTGDPTRQEQAFAQMSEYAQALVKLGVLSNFKHQIHLCALFFDLTKSTGTAVVRRFEETLGLSKI